MHKYIKKTLSVMLATAVTFTSVSVTDLVGTKNVYAVSNVDDWENKDEVTVDGTMIRDANLLAALKDIINNGKSFKGKDLKNYTGDIDLSGKSNIYDLTGLGYAINAKSINLSGTSVEKINKYEFLECKFKKVVLPDGLEEIGEHAFSQCHNLSEINIPESVTKIHNGAFNKCEALKEIDFPDDLELLGNESFANCTSLKEVIIPDKIKAASEASADEGEIGIGINVFSGCTSLESVTFGRNMTVIPAAFLQDTDSLTSINIPSWIVGIDESAFCGSSIHTIDISKNTKIEYIKASTFANCNYLQTIKLPKNIKSIDESAFENCVRLEKGDQLASLTQLETIKANAFRNSGLTILSIPENVMNIEDSAFQDCSSLKAVTFLDFPEDSLREMNKVIGKNAFRDCKKLTNIIFPKDSQDRSNCTFEIGFRAFSGCISLAGDIEFPRNLVKIGDEAFADCGRAFTDWERDKCGYTMRRYYMTDINKIYDYSAEGTSGETIFTTADKKYYQPTMAYIDWSDVHVTKPTGTYFEVFIQTPHDKVTEDELKDLSGEYKMHYQYFEGVKELNFSECVNAEFGEGVFMGCVNLDTVILPDSLVEIPAEMFRDTSTDVRMANNSTVRSLAKNDPDEVWYKGLKYVDMSPNVKVIGVSAFRDSHNLTFYNEDTGIDRFPKKLEKICDYAFAGCESLSKVTLGSTVKGIGKYAFKGTSRIADSLMVPKIGLKKVDVMNASNLGYIGDDAFEDCALESFNLNENAPVYAIKGSTFANCQYLTSTKLSKNVKKVYSKAFAKTTRMKSLIIPDNCTVDLYAFDGYFTSKYYDSTATIYVDDDISTSKFIYAAKVPTISISFVDKNQTVRLNGELTLPYIVTNYVKDNPTCIKSVKVGEKEYTYNSTTGELEGNTNNVAIEPVLYNDKFKFKGLNTVNGSSENIECPAWAAKLYGHEVGKENVSLTSELHFKLLDGVAKRSTEVSYAVNVTANPCKEIVLNDCSEKQEYNISISSSKALTISPTFVPTYDDSEITDLPVWKIESNSELIDMNVADGGKSASFTKKANATYGTAKVSVTAGPVTKEFYINVTVPAKSVKLSESSKGLLVGNADSITATLIYSSDYTSLSTTYPDSVKVSSSDSEIVQVTSYEMLQDGSYKIYFTGKTAGTAKIRVTALASNTYSECTVNVAMDGVVPVLKNSANEIVQNGSRISIQGKNSVVLSYEYTNGFQDKDMNCDIYPINLFSTKVDTSKKKVTIAPLKKGSGKITFYPPAGSSSNNGVTVYFDVDANVAKKGISLKKSSIPLDTTVSVFDYMQNDFYAGKSDPNIADNKITEANAENYARLTNNRIEFTSSDPSTASVDNYGNVKGLKLTEKGKSVTITCTAYNGNEIVASASTTVSVIKPDLTDMSYSGKTEISVGEVSEWTIIYAPQNCIIESEEVSGFDKSIVSASINVSNGSVVVSVKGLKVGETTVKVSIKGGSTSKKLSIPVKVIKKEDVYGGQISGKSLGKIKIKKIKAGKKKATLKWKLVKGASGYEIQMSTKKKKGYKKAATIKSGKKSSYVKKKLKSKKTYYFKIRAYGTNTSGKKIYSKWSSPKKVKVK